MKDGEEQSLERKRKGDENKQGLKLEGRKTQERMKSDECEQQRQEETER